MKAPNIKLCTSVKCEGNHVLHGVGQSLGVLDKGGASKRTKVAMNTLYWKDMSWDTNFCSIVMKGSCNSLTSSWDMSRTPQMRNILKRRSYNFLKWKHRISILVLKSGHDVIYIYVLVSRIMYVTDIKLKNRAGVYITFK